MNEPKSLRILHVEDSDIDAKLVEYALQDSLSNAYSLLRCRTVNEAFKFIEQESIDLVLLDLNLPDSRGLETVKRLKSFAIDSAIVVLTGSGDEVSGLDAVKYGAQDYLTKDELTHQTAPRVIRYSMERHKYDRQVAALANTDTLTGQPNRNRFLSHLEHELASAHRHEQSLALLFIDLDKFKLVNDTYGHLTGDEYLKAVSTRMREAMRSSDFFARIGGDEFVIVTRHDAEHVNEPIILAQKIVASLASGIDVSGHRLESKCSIGIATYDGDQTQTQPTADQFLHEADTAMYASKASGGNKIRFLDRELEEHANTRINVLRQLGSALVDEEFYLVYQPIFNLGSSSIDGMEALLRWRKRSGKIIYPNDFIPVLEESGLIQKVGLWVFKQALHDFSEAKKYGDTPPEWVSVNLSPIQLNEPGLGVKLNDIIRSSSVKPNEIRLEITENSLLKNEKITKKNIDSIRKLGIKLSLDDFGTGYSSMHYIKNIEADTLKIDKSFILRCDEQKKDLAITKAMISIAKNLEMKVVAEGVENQQIFDLLAQEECNYIQGYFISKPIEMDELIQFLKTPPTFHKSAKIDG